MTLPPKYFNAFIALVFSLVCCSAQTSNSALSVTPNPFSKRAVANYTIGSNDTIRLDVFDRFGKLISSPVKNRVLKAGSYADTIALDYQPADNYFVLLTTGSTKPIALRVSKEAPQDTLECFEVRSFHPNGFLNVVSFERFEVGLRLNSFYDSQIERFLNAQTGSTLNPYNPEDRQVAITFTHLPTSNVYSRNGFYFQDISVKGNFWHKEITEFPFRIRFAPPLSGNYKCTASVLIYGNLLCQKDFTFSVTAGGNPGHIKLNHPLRRMQFSNDEMFFAIGENIAWADWEYIYNPNFPSGFTNFWETMSSPRTHQQQRSFISDLADNSGNFVRIRLDPWSVPIESVDKTIPRGTVPLNTADLVKYVNNYHHNQMFMSEMDNTLKVCEEQGVYIMLNILNDIELNINDTADYGAGSLAGWPRNPYSGLLNDKSLSGIRNFFTSESAIQNFKKRLRYIEARWGYSTSVGVWQIINETENISGDYKNPKYNYKYWDDDANFRNEVYNWLCDIRYYLRSFYPKHLVTTGMAGGRGIPDTEAADFLSCLDIVSKHDYTHEFDKKSKQYSARDYNRNQEAIEYFHQERPFIWGEIGLADDVSSLNVYGNAAYHNSIWASLFSGSIGTVLNFKDWPQGAGFRHRDHLNGVKAFSDRINFKQKLLPCLNNSAQKGSHIEYATSKIFTVWMKREDNLVAYGWSRNNSFNWLSETFPNMPPKDQIEVKLVTGWNGEAEFNSFEAEDAIIKIKNLNPKTKYRIDIYNTWDDYGLLETQYERTDKQGLLSFGREMPYFVESPWYPDYAFVLTDIETKQDKNAKSLAEGVYPVPAHDRIVVQANFDADLLKTVKIIDASGRVLIRQMSDNFEIGLDDLSDGFYILEINNGVMTQCIKFIVLHN